MTFAFNKIDNCWDSICDLQRARLRAAATRGATGFNVFAALSKKEKKKKDCVRLCACVGVPREDYHL